MWCVQTKVLQRGLQSLVPMLLIARLLVLTSRLQRDAQLPGQMAQTTSSLRMQIFPWRLVSTTLHEKEK
jgi:hypothetical protein